MIDAIETMFSDCQLQHSQMKFSHWYGFVDPPFTTEAWNPKYLERMMGLKFISSCSQDNVLEIQSIYDTPCELGGWGWSHPFSSGPAIFLYKLPCLNLQNGNFSTKCLALDRLLHYKMSAEKRLKQS